MAQEVVDLVNQGLTRQQIVAKLANHNDQTVYKIIVRVLATTASDAQLATELTRFRLLLTILSFIVDDLRKNDPEGVYQMDLEQEITRVTVVPSTSKKMHEMNGNGIVSVDGCFMAGEGTILAAVLRDGNGKIQLLGYQLCRGESNENWRAFLMALKEGAGMTKDTLFFADRPSFLANCFKEVFGADFNYFGRLQHLTRDAANWCQKEGMSPENAASIIRLIKEAAYVPSTEEYLGVMARIRDANYAVWEHLNGLKTLWAGIQRSHRFGYMTSNNIESFNARIAKECGSPMAIRSMHVFRAVMYLYELYIRQILERQRSVLKMVDRNEYYLKNGCILTSYAKRIVRNNMDKVAKSAFSLFVDRSMVYHPMTNKLYEVNFQNRSCSCGYFQDMKLPCVHALALMKGLSEEEFWKECTRMSHPHYLVGTVLLTTNYFLTKQ